MGTVWSGLSQAFAETVDAVHDGIVTVQGGGRGTASGVVWRPGVVVTVRQGIRRAESLQVALGGEPIKATLAGTDAGTDLAVLRIDNGSGKVLDSASSGSLRVGELVLSVGRSALGVAGAADRSMLSSVQTCGFMWAYLAALW
jgi:serine protease Do